MSHLQCQLLVVHVLVEIALLAVAQAVTELGLAPGLEHHVGDQTLELLRGRVARPETLKPEAYERTLRARAFDVARYLLPLATNTSLGQIVNARVTWGTAQQPTVPILAVTRIGGQSFVYVAAAQGSGYMAHQVAVTLGEPVGNLYPVISGLHTGDRVIVSGIQLLQEGPQLGVYAVCLDADEQLLPAECQAVVVTEHGRVRVQQAKAETLSRIRPDGVYPEWCERLARSLAPIRDARASPPKRSSWAVCSRGSCRLSQRCSSCWR